MKTFKRTLFWVASIMMLPYFLAVALLASICGFIFAVIAPTIDVGDVVWKRFEHWAYDVPRGSFINCPFKHTLLEVWLDAYRSYTQ